MDFWRYIDFIRNVPFAVWRKQFKDRRKQETINIEYAQLQRCNNVRLASRVLDFLFRGIWTMFLS